MTRGQLVQSPVGPAYVSMITGATVVLRTVNGHMPLVYSAQAVERMPALVGAKHQPGTVRRRRSARSERSTGAKTPPSSQKRPLPDPEENL